jgi:hypothetical protein
VTLTLLVPAALEEEVEGIMIEHEPIAAAGFTVRDVRYHGDDATFRNIVEQIRGHTRMIEVTATLPQPNAASLLALIGEALPGRGITFRTNPAGEIGRIG